MLNEFAACTPWNLNYGMYSPWLFIGIINAKQWRTLSNNGNQNTCVIVWLPLWDQNLWKSWKENIYHDGKFFSLLYFFISMFNNRKKRSSTFINWSRRFYRFVRFCRIGLKRKRNTLLLVQKMVVTYLVLFEYIWNCF